MIGLEYIFIPKEVKVIVLKGQSWWLGAVGNGAVKEHGYAAGLTVVEYSEMTGTMPEMVVIGLELGTVNQMGAKLQGCVDNR